MSLTEKIVQQHLDSEERFPVSLADAQEWIGYSLKHHAVRALNRWMVEGVDFSPAKVKKTEGETRGRQSVEYWLTIDAFKQFCMVANTDKGREVRLYFIECERRYKALLKQQPATPSRIVTESLEPLWVSVRPAQGDLFKPEPFPVLPRPLSEEFGADEYLSVTAIAHLLRHLTGGKIALTPQKFNTLLCHAGYQIPTAPNMNEPRWEPTDAAQPHCNGETHETRVWQVHTAINALFVSWLSEANLAIGLWHSIGHGWNVATECTTCDGLRSRTDAIATIAEMRGELVAP